MTKQEMEKIKDNLMAFQNNFGEVRIENYVRGGGYYVYLPKEAPEGEYIQFCYDIDYLNGWLYGCVQGFLRKEFKDGANKLKEEKKGIYVYS